MLAIRLDTKVEERLTQLARKTGRTKTYFAREAILEPLEELEDTHLALERFADPARIDTAAEVKRALDL